MVWPWFAVSWTPLRHRRVCLLRWHKFHTWLKAAHTTLSNLWKSSRNSIENFIHSFTNVNILLHSLSYPLSPFLSMCMRAHAWKCVCVYPFIPRCLFPKHKDIILHNHSYVTKSGNSTPTSFMVLSFLKNMVQFFIFSFLIDVPHFQCFWCLLMVKFWLGISNQNTIHVMICPFSVYFIQRFMVSICIYWWY